MRRFYTQILVLFTCLALSTLTLNAQPWTYDFGTGTGTANNANSGSGNTAFFPGTPSGGGTYRVRIGTGSGSLVLANPGTSLGTGTEAQLTATTGGSSNKFTVYNWNSPSSQAYVKFKMRTTSSGNGDIYLHLGSGAGIFTDNNGATSYNISIATLLISYSSGTISSVSRRANGSSFVAVTGHGLSKDSDQTVEIYGNNSSSPTTYSKDGSNSLSAQSWDMWVDGVKISPSGGWAKAGTWAANSNIAGFGFFGENSAANAAKLYLDDLEYSNTLPSSCSAPSTATSSFTNGTAADSTTSIKLNWTNGNGAGRVIVMNAINSFTNLADGANPTASTSYSGSGEQVIYNGTSGTGPITITGLLANTTYYFKGYEYCSPDKVYKNDGAEESLKTAVGSNFIITTPANFGPFCNNETHNISVAYTPTGSFAGSFKVQISDENGIFPLDASTNIIGTGVSPISATIPASKTAGTGYRVRVVNDTPLTFGDDNGSNVQIIASPTTPTTSNPVAVCQGSAVSITATGSTNATSYTFWDQATGGFQITSGVSGNTLTTPNNLSVGSHSYFIQGENGICLSDRKEVVVTVVASPTTPSGTYSYSANPSCGPASISYDAGYYFQTASDGESFAKPTSSAYTLNASGTIYVRAFNGTCWSSSVASSVVTINNSINISTQPSNKSIVEGGSGTISVSATNVASYQWQVNDGCGWTDLSNTGKYSGTTTNTLSISNPTLDMSSLQYRVVLRANTPCTDLTSNVAILTVNIPSGSIWSNPITDASASIISPYTNGQSKASNLTVSGVVLVGASKTSAGDRFNANSWSSTLDLDKYFSFTLTPASGYVLNVSSLNVNLQSSAAGPNAIAIRTSLDGFGSNIYSSAHAQSARPEEYNISINATNLTSAIEVRLYAYGSASGTFSVNDFDFSGSVIAVCTPPTIDVQPHDISACYNKFKVETLASSPTYQWEAFDANSSSWNKILSCNEDYTGGQTSQLSLVGNLSSLDGNQYRVKVVSNDCPIYSDVAKYSAQPIILDVNELGVNYLDGSSCDYNGWTYYTYDDLEGRYAFAINWAPSGMISVANQSAKTDAEVVLTLDNNYFKNEENIGGIAYATYTMKRYWNVNTLSAIDEPVNVQFPYLQSEVDEIVQAAQAYQAANPSSKYENFNWFKIVGEDFVPNSTIVTPVNIINSIRLENSFAGQQSASFKIAQFNDIVSFSGGSGATGVGGLNNPLPVTLLYFVGDCQNNDVNLSWATATELNADKFIVEASFNGKDFSSIGEVDASGNSTTIKLYNFKIASSNYSYYRLKQVDFDGKFEFSKIIETPCNSVKDASKSYYSTSEGFVVELLSSSNKKVQLSITSVNGQLVYSQSKNVVKGTQRWTISSSNLPVGIYVITVGDQFESKSTKVSVY